MQRRTTVDVNPNIAGILSLFDPALDWSADLSGDEYESGILFQIKFCLDAVP